VCAGGHPQRAPPHGRLDAQDARGTGSPQVPHAGAQGGGVLEVAAPPGHLGQGGAQDAETAHVLQGVGGEEGAGVEGRRDMQGGGGEGGKQNLSSSGGGAGAA
jgi:hypothetical protein